METKNVSLTMDEQRELCEMICREIDGCRIEKVTSRNENDRAAVQARIDSLTGLLKKLEV